MALENNVFDHQKCDYDPCDLHIKNTLQKIAIFNPGRSWDKMAWAYVTSNEDAHDIGGANGYFSWKIEEDEIGKRMEIFKSSVEELLKEN